MLRNQLMLFKVLFKGLLFLVKMFQELINFQSTEITELENKRVWLTEVFTGRYFNKLIKGEISAGFMKRVIINGATGVIVYNRYNCN